MLVTELRELAVEEGACIQGLDYLDQWIKKHPNATASEFFISQRNVSRNTFTAFSPHGYLRWCFRKMLNWQEVNVLPDIMWSISIKAHELLKEILNSDTVIEASPRKLADALARAYAD